MAYKLEKNKQPSFSVSLTSIKLLDRYFYKLSKMSSLVAPRHYHSVQSHFYSDHGTARCVLSGKSDPTARTLKKNHHHHRNKQQKSPGSQNARHQKRPGGNYHVPFVITDSQVCQTSPNDHLPAAPKDVSPTSPNPETIKWWSIDELVRDPSAGYFTQEYLDKLRSGDIDHPGLYKPKVWCEEPKNFIK